MKAYVTGASGFIGGQVARKLLERGYDVTVLARSPASVAGLEARGAHIVQGDITDRESMRRDMRGSDVVFHIAGWYKIGTRDKEQGRRINVDGTRNVLGLAVELGVPRIVYTSTVAVFGDTKGQVVDESYVGPEGPFLSEYDRTKWAAHYRVALPLIERGAPIIIVMPGGVFGPGDTSLMGALMGEFYRGKLPYLPGPETMITYAYVDDIAEGHILAAERGRPGESYILAGPPMTFAEIMSAWEAASGRQAPRLRLPARWLRPLAPAMAAVGSKIPLPEMYSGETLAILGSTYLAHSAKARDELGWRSRPVPEGLALTFDWLAQNSRPQSRPAVLRGAQAAGMGAVALFAVWLAWRSLRRWK